MTLDAANSPAPSPTPVPLGRRKITYASLAELEAEAERAVACSAGTCGNWTLGQILEHLARGLEGAVQGFPFRSSLPVRLVARWVVLPVFLWRGMPAGYKLKGAQAEALVPSPMEAAEALAHLKRAIALFREARQFPAHAIFGPLSPELSQRLQLRHAELHMSFVAFER